MLLVQFSFPKADKMKCFLMFESVEFFVRCYCRRWVRRGLCRTSGARAVNVADPLALWSRSLLLLLLLHTQDKELTHLVTCWIAFLNYHNFGFQISGSLMGECVL